MENNNNNITELTIYYKPPGEDFTIKISFSENFVSTWKEFEIHILIDATLVFSRDCNKYTDLIMKNEEEYEKYSYSIEEILNLVNLRRYIHG